MMNQLKQLVIIAGANGAEKITLTCPGMSSRLFNFLVEMLQIGNRAVLKAQEKNRKKGIPNVYAKNGKPIFELPNGKITSVNPFKFLHDDGDEK